MTLTYHDYHWTGAVVGVIFATLMVAVSSEASRVCLGGVAALYFAFVFSAELAEKFEGGWIVGYIVGITIMILAFEGPYFIGEVVTIGSTGFVGYKIGDWRRKIGLDVEKSISSASRAVKEAKNTVSPAKGEIKEAEAIFDISKARSTLEEATELLKMRRYKEAKKLAQKAEELAKGGRIAFRDTTEVIKDVMKVINDATEIINNAESFGYDIWPAKKVIEEASSVAKSAIKRADLEELKKAKRLANEAQEVAKRIKAENKSKIEFELYPEEEFRPHSWQKCQLKVSNVGKAHAKDVWINFSEEVEVKDLAGIEILKRGESKVLWFSLKPTDLGEVPVDVEVNFKDVDGESYTDAKRFYLDVTPEIPEVEVTIRDLELLREKIEEITHSSVGVEKLKQDVKTLESSKIMVEMVETSYQKAVRTEYFLDKLKLLGGYTEGLSGRLTKEINRFRRFLKEELFEYVDEEHKVDVRRFCRNLLDIWIAEVLKER